MKFTRKTNEFEYADYISENGMFRIRDMSIHSNAIYWEHVEQGNPKSEYWALLQNDKIVRWGKTVRELKAYAETIEEV